LTAQRFHRPWSRGSFDWQHFRILNFTAHRPCGCRHLANLESFPAHCSIGITWRCRAVPWKRRSTLQVNFLPITFNTVTTPDGILAQKDGVHSDAYIRNPTLDPEPKKGYITLDDLRKVVEAAITNQWKLKDGSGTLAGRWKEILERLAAARAPDPAP
jgi:hypothetical protein